MSNEINDAQLFEAGVGEFRFEHLPEYLQEISRGYAKRALWMMNAGPLMERASEQRRIALHYLLLSKDAAVRMHVMEKDHRHEMEQRSG